MQGQRVARKLRAEDAVDAGAHAAREGTRSVPATFCGRAADGTASEPDPFSPSDSSAEKC